MVCGAVAFSGAGAGAGAAGCGVAAGAGGAAPGLAGGGAGRAQDAQAAPTIISNVAALTAIGRSIEPEREPQQGPRGIRDYPCPHEGA